MTTSTQWRIVVMGVSGCGKSAVGVFIASEVKGSFIDADSLHTPANLAKMASATPLTDPDREPWLREVGTQLAESTGVVVVGCSALKRRYRDIIRASAPDAVFIHLQGDRELLHARMISRTAHFMPASLCDSQLAALEPLAADEHGYTMSIAEAPSVIARHAAEWLASLAPPTRSGYWPTRDFGIP